MAFKYLCNCCVIHVLNKPSVTYTPFGIRWLFWTDTPYLAAHVYLHYYLPANWLHVITVMLEATIKWCRVHSDNCTIEVIRFEDTITQLQAFPHIFGTTLALFKLWQQILNQRQLWECYWTLQLPDESKWIPSGCFIKLYKIGKHLETFTITVKKCTWY